MVAISRSRSVMLMFVRLYSSMNASAAAQGTGLDLSKNAAFDMGYQGIAGGTDKIKLKTSGNVARVTRDIFRVTGEGDQVATITWTVEPGAHTA